MGLVQTNQEVAETQTSLVPCETKWDYEDLREVVAK
jgi:hypothetical protein